MERILTVHASHQAQLDADTVEMASIPPQERLDRALALIARHHEDRRDAEQRLAQLLALFTDSEVDFLVVGGHAVAYHGYPRYTQDLDLLLRPTHQNGERVVRALTQFGFGSLDITADDFTADDRVIQLGRAPNRVDLLTRLYGVEFDEAWSTAVEGQIDGVAVRLIGADALIRNKRATGRPQDLADADRLTRVRDVTR
jgi:hypothetical protein